MLTEIFNYIQEIQSHSIQRRNIAHWLKHGRIPWQRGYIEYKAQTIQRVLADQVVMDQFTQAQPTLPDHYGEHIDERIIEFPWFLTKLPAGSATVLDAGSTVNHGYILQQPIWQNKDLTIMTLAPEADNFWHKKISYVWGDLRDMPFRDNWFDVVTCISTLEHVGMNNAIYTSDTKYQENNQQSYLRAVAEFKRVLKPDGVFYLTVPYGQYKQCGFQQVFDRTLLRSVLDQFAGEVICEQFYRYGLTGWKLATQVDCDDCDYFNIHATPAPAIDGAAAARAVACVMIRK